MCVSADVWSLLYISCGGRSTPGGGQIARHTAEWDRAPKRPVIAEGLAEPGRQSESAEARKQHWQACGKGHVGRRRSHEGEGALLRDGALR